MGLNHCFSGKVITNKEFENLKPRNVFHRQLEPLSLPEEHLNRHILFRKKFNIGENFGNAKIFISADDYYKLYINGVFVASGPAPAYHFNYPYNEIDVSSFLKKGENVIAVHTLYQGLINRVWVSGDNRHGLILDLEIDRKNILKSDESFLTACHTAYKAVGVHGINTQFKEDYDANAAEVGFENPDFDDGNWENALLKQNTDYTLSLQSTKMLDYEDVLPKATKQIGNRIIFDFGGCFVGYLQAAFKGEKGNEVTVRCGQELLDDGFVRFKMRCTSDYEEKIILSGKTDKLDWFDYKSFRYAEFVLPEGVTVSDVSLTARHYPFELKAKMAEEFKNNENAKRIWSLAVRTQKYGVQEVIQDCMDREKGFYVGDGCYTALTHFILTGDDSVCKKLIDDFLASTFITDTGVTCVDCSFMQEIAEYPFYFMMFLLWFLRITNDKEYVKSKYQAATKIMDAFKRDYEKDFLLQNLDKWCVVEWPANFRDGYDVDITEGKVCKEAHIALNAFYIEAIRSLNAIAKEIGNESYRDENELSDAFYASFKAKNGALFKDSTETEHVSFIGNVYTYGFRLYKTEEERAALEKFIEEREITSVSFFGAFVMLVGLIRHGRYDLFEKFLTHEGAWLRILREDGTATFEGWGKDTKWNTSLFHLTLSFVALFLSDTDKENLFK